MVQQNESFPGQIQSSSIHVDQLLGIHARQSFWTPYAAQRIIRKTNLTSWPSDSFDFWWGFRAYQNNALSALEQRLVCIKEVLCNVLTINYS